MANLTPITQGMQQGAQAIQSNFEALSKLSQQDTGWVKMAVQNATGGVDLRRIGNVVYGRGIFQPTIDSSLANGHLLFNIPASMQPDAGYSFASVFAGGIPGQLRLQIDGVKVSMIATPDSATQAGFQFDLIWITAAAFPAS